ncbi:adrenodoxin-type ferredoxin, putative [Plasmodium berghei]|uniref:Adrenodoxin-type ferredoxin, putative n=2 Tax=Plasmodium berghei TaxID=5821 RepID=A0A509AQQ2_PLABA|nr:adrenodoxin-type ferredoxin, putative [Plasmodium berghei ANKA]CXJ19426.1 adrenodoxin-type ferredoxin, putative [Plasmodium berghei]SCM26485.1 adrenodoxin-type ferredoxin, putative [Plasmodium berghei]SCN28482.1 adrenodoxin-type ferredoxin, putative [Plasmodium berghei]SCO62672.1 adrenodoxin-type ferredoxin, putative [Plasmodium berghei]SCO64233.1 adrenodoxin-type ferredoxin, putative [Plasmodium berghei]|eukprot:XP_034424128.1 adrenodoxin-type ferredoxin, putative [Plasmodium berghei ANKA]
MNSKFSFPIRNNIFKRFLPSKSKNNYLYLNLKKKFTTQNSDEINVTFLNHDNHETTVKAQVGDSILKVAHENNINIEGACEGFCACSTCHVIIDNQFYELLPEAQDNELDMLELAPCITETSRLGCQVKLTKELDGMKIKLPPMTRNFYVDGYVPTPH